MVACLQAQVVQGIAIRFSAGARFLFVKSVQTCWRSPCLLFNRYQGPFLLEISDGGVKFTAHLHRKRRLGMTGVTPPFLPYPFMVATGAFLDEVRRPDWLLSWSRDLFVPPLMKRDEKVKQFVNRTVDRTQGNLSATIWPHFMDLCEIKRTCLGNSVL